uniref:Chromatin binding protein, putative n=1 Tax=Arundo donax TaxID=35708 RepID=A0A0A8XRA0_ARUDO
MALSPKYFSVDLHPFAVKLPELLAFVNMEEDALNKLQQKLLDILKFLQKNQSTFFLSVYDGVKTK